MCVWGGVVQHCYIVHMPELSTYYSGGRSASCVASSFSSFCSYICVFSVWLPAPHDLFFVGSQERLLLNRLQLVQNLVNSVRIVVLVQSHQPVVVQEGGYKKGARRNTGGKGGQLYYKKMNASQRYRKSRKPCKQGR